MFDQLGFQEQGHSEVSVDTSQLDELDEAYSSLFRTSVLLLGSEPHVCVLLACLIISEVVSEWGWVQNTSGDLLGPVCGKPDEGAPWEI